MNFVYRKKKTRKSRTHALTQRHIHKRVEYVSYKESQKREIHMNHMVFFSSYVLPSACHTSSLWFPLFFSFAISARFLLSSSSFVRCAKRAQTININNVLCMHNKKRIIFIRTQHKKRSFFISVMPGEKKRQQQNSTNSTLRDTEQQSRDRDHLTFLVY